MIVIEIHVKSAEFHERSVRGLQEVHKRLARVCERSVTDS